MTRPAIPTVAEQIAVREATKAHLAARPNRLQVPDHMKGKLYSPRDLLEHNIALQMQGVPAIPSGQGPSLEAIRAFRARRSAGVSAPVRQGVGL